MTKTHGPEETRQFASIFAESLPQKAMILLDGELGAGKTCFVRGLCEGLGGDPTQVNSPTFTIMQEYDIGRDRRLIHIDVYRLSGSSELESIGWEELCTYDNAIIAIEWPNKIEDSLPLDAIRISIEHCSEQEREINILQSSTGETA